MEAEEMHTPSLFVHTLLVAACVATPTANAALSTWQFGGVVEYVGQTCTEESGCTPIVSGYEPGLSFSGSFTIELSTPPQPGNYGNPYYYGAVRGARLTIGDTNFSYDASPAPGDPPYFNSIHYYNNSAWDSFQMNAAMTGPSSGEWSPFAMVLNIIAVPGSLTDTALYSTPPSFDAAGVTRTNFFLDFRSAVKTDMVPTVGGRLTNFQIASPVPEPSALALWLLGLLVVPLAARRVKEPS